MRNKGALTGLLILGALGVLSLSCAVAEGKVPAPEPDVSLKVKPQWVGSYAQDIQPIFDGYCVQCHGPGVAENGLRLDSYEGVMKGTKYGPVVVSGLTAGSTLIAVLERSTDPQIGMPYKTHSLSSNRLANIAAWIEAGAKK